VEAMVKETKETSFVKGFLQVLVYGHTLCLKNKILSLCSLSISIVLLMCGGDKMGVSEEIERTRKV
jgi:hypothetical protein